MVLVVALALAVVEGALNFGAGLEVPEQPAAKAEARTPAAVLRASLRQRMRRTATGTLGRVSGRSG